MIKKKESIRIDLSGFPTFHQMKRPEIILKDKYLYINETSSRDTQLISIIIPIYCEEALIDELLRRLIQTTDKLKKSYNYELIFINDGSTDNSLNKLIEYQKSNSKIKIIDLSRNFGHQLAISAGLEHALGDAIILIDGDLQDPPELIIPMLKHWSEGFEVVYGQRKKRDGESFFKLFTAKLFYRLLNSLSNTKLPVDAGDFRLLDRKVVDQILNLPESHRYIRGLVNWVGFKHLALPYMRDKRYSGKTKYSLRKMISFALDGITSFSTKPLVLSGFFSIIFAAIFFYGILRIVYDYYSGAENLVSGWSSIMITLCLTGSILLFILAIFGVYMGRIYTEVKRRPLFIVREIYSGE